MRKMHHPPSDQRGALRASHAGRSTAGDLDDDNSDDEEIRRLAYLRCHRAMLEQKQRLETERRVDEVVRDQASIKERETRLREERGQEKPHKAPNGRAASLPSLGTSASPPTLGSVGMYTNFDELSHEMLRVIAEKQALRDMAPLNTRGKYHARYMKDAYPIAGTQLKLEREREMILKAKKKLLLSKLPGDVSNVADRIHIVGSSRDGNPLPYRKLDFHIDRYSSVLKHEETHVSAAIEQRNMRLAEVQHREGLEAFWILMFTQRYHEVVAWLKSRRFRDINVPVVVREIKQRGKKEVEMDSSSGLCVDLNRDVGMTPLMAACSLHHVDIVTALLDQRAAVHITTANGDAATHFLWRGWQAETMSTLKSAAQFLLQADRTIHIFRLLIEHKADMNLQNAFGETALQHSARLGLSECVELLLKHGADPCLPDRHGQSALSYARANGHQSIAKLMQNYATVERAKDKEREWRRYNDLLHQKRGALTADWSPSPEKLLARLAVEDRRAGHLRNQYVDRHGHVIACQDDDD